MAARLKKGLFNTSGIHFGQKKDAGNSTKQNKKKSF